MLNSTVFASDFLQRGFLGRPLEMLNTQHPSPAPVRHPVGDLSREKSHFLKKVVGAVHQGISRAYCMHLSHAVGSCRGDIKSRTLPTIIMNRRNPVGLMISCQLREVHVESKRIFRCLCRLVAVPRSRLQASHGIARSSRRVFRTDR